MHKRVHNIEQGYRSGFLRWVSDHICRGHLTKGPKPPQSSSRKCVHTFEPFKKKINASRLQFIKDMSKGVFV